MSSSSLYLVRGRLCRALTPRPWHIVKRYKFSGRGPTTPTPAHSKTALLPSIPARTRFAPSPTGYLHIGSLRTALYNYLLAKATGGQFILRIEDTDQSRLVPDAESSVYEDLRWAGLQWDEGPDIPGICGPYKQSQRLQHYSKHARQLMEGGRAYRCFCTPEELDQTKALRLQSSEPSLYSGKCSHIPPEESLQRAEAGELHCVRFKSDGSPTISDLVYGTYHRPDALDDFVIVKRDGYPTYHFANVVDDHLMDITHVIRGAEWLVSTPKHVALYEAFGWQPPAFAHVGLLVDKDNQKLSKRNGMADLKSWKQKDYLPVALLNYLMLLGWSPIKGEKSKKSEVMNMNDMITEFHLRFTKGNIMINEKADFFQQAHMRSLVAREVEPDLFADSFFPSIDRAIRMCEKERRASPGGGGLVARLSGRLGPLVPRARLPDKRKNPAPGAPDHKVYTDYIREIFSLDSKTYKHATEYLIRGKYLVWELPESVYTDGVEVAMKRYHGFYLVPLSQRQTMKKKAKEKGDWVAPKPDEENSYSWISLSDLTARLRNILSSIPEKDWHTKSFQAKVLPFTETIFGTSKTGSVQPWGYPFLRWALYGAAPGPSLMQSMKVLGKEQTMKRVQLAYECAKKVEDQKEEMEDLASLELLAS